MKSILAIGINTTLEEKSIIQRKLQTNNISLDIASIKDPVFKIVDGIVSVDIKGKDLSSYDYIWIQSGWNTTHMAYLLHLCLDSQKILHNKPNTHLTKLSDIFALALNGIPVPNTFFHNGLKIDDENILEIGDICKTPCIYKTSLGSLGSNVFLIEDVNSIKQTIKDKSKYNRYIFQEYIPNDYDYRVIIANGSATSICKRTRVHDKYRNNTALGAKEDFLKIQDISHEIIDIAIQAANTLDLNWAGVDIVTDKVTSKNYVLEVNRRPGLTQCSLETIAAFKYVSELVGIS